MRPRVSRLVLLAALAGAVAVIVVAGLKLKDPLLERWKISRLEAGDPGERVEAVEWLRLRGSARAVPGLINELERVLAAARKEAESKSPGRATRDVHENLFDSPPRFPPAAALLAIMNRLPGDSARMLARDTTPRLTPYLALRSLGARADAAVPELVRKLEGADGFAWGWVPDILARIGPAAHPALPLILDRLRKAEPGYPLLARNAGSIAARADVPALLALLESAEPPVRRAALWAFERMGQRAAAAVPALEACLHDADDEVQNLAWMALASIREDQGPRPAPRARSK